MCRFLLSRSIAGTPVLCFLDLSALRPILFASPPRPLCVSALAVSPTGSSHGTVRLQAPSLPFCCCSARPCSRRPLASFFCCPDDIAPTLALESNPAAVCVCMPIRTASRNSLNLFGAARRRVRAFGSAPPACACTSPPVETRLPHSIYVIAHQQRQSPPNQALDPSPTRPHPTNQPLLHYLYTRPFEATKSPLPPYSCSHRLQHLDLPSSPSSPSSPRPRFTQLTRAKAHAPCLHPPYRLGPEVLRTRRLAHEAQDRRP